MKSATCTDRLNAEAPAARARAFQFFESWKIEKLHGCALSQSSCRPKSKSSCKVYPLLEVSLLRKATAVAAGTLDAAVPVGPLQQLLVTTTASKAQSR